MSIIKRLQLFYFCRFSKPASDRPIYQKIRQYHPKKIVELGIADGARALRMVEFASQFAPSTEIHYVGMDPFEGRSEQDGPPLSLKQVHQQLRPTGARVQLVPGNPVDSLIRLANSLGKVDLLIVPERFDASTFARLWYFIPRMLHERTLIFIERQSSDGQRSLRLKPRREVHQLATLGVNHRAA